MSRIDAINLLPTSRLKFDQEKLSNQLKKYAFLVITVLIIVLLAVFGYQFWLNRQKTVLVKEKESLTYNLSQFSTQLELLQRLRQRLKLVSGLLDSRTSSYDEMTEVISFLPENIFIDNFQVRGKEVRLRGELGSIFEVKELEDGVAEARKSTVYRRINLENLRKSETGWLFGLTIFKK